MSLRLLVSLLMMLSAVALGMIAYQLVNRDTRPVVTVAALQGAIPPLQIGYIITAHPLPAGTLIRDEDFTLKSSLPADVPANAITDLPENRASLRGALIRHYMDGGTI